MPEYSELSYSELDKLEKSVKAEVRARALKQELSSTIYQYLIPFQSEGLMAHLPYEDAIKLATKAINAAYARAD